MRPITPTTPRKTLDGVAETVALARAWVREQCALRGIDADTVDRAVLIASEFATNAIKHSRSGRPGGTYTVHTEFQDSTLYLSVTDNGAPYPPYKQPRGNADGELPENGQGLWLVEAHADWWRALKFTNHHTITAKLTTT
ncbi:ATP-binding protein [Spiractinospora alimapuensis]|uniref:ATP-binding protein n=1 Tax=Spiractinospora alimapuensis TaxID=2820884 RepID=UPI001F23AB52|nr:ATP-binding protein [Spiractinospora alimapuensis]QVQ54179.1 ATP-binding protein [Spiractinospora alimapuensis]